MALFKCKMCGGTLEINPNDAVATCDYCGTPQTLPRLYDERRTNLYDRANHFRRNNEFDKAISIYEQILNDDTTDAESYWSLVLCRYGIEYVEDPVTHKHIPTINRTQFTSVFDDNNYKSALQYSNSDQRLLYEQEAKAINEIQKSILAISLKEEPFDVFICYKETDKHGRRTPDSVLANELYYQLTQEGFHVFFSRITLEDKLGVAYEPYIFAALNSAKIMVVLGTKPEHFQSAWVKNEWSRYLSLIKNGANKILIPAYRDMDPYDLPDEFSHLQAQDMSKLGFMQDLIRGIKKMIQPETPKQSAIKETVITESNVNTAPLLKRAFMFLEDGDWNNADDYCEKVLDIDPECAKAYVGKLMAELHVRRQEELKNCEWSFENTNNYQKAERFADDILHATLIGYIDHINERNRNAGFENLYTSAKTKMDVLYEEIICDENDDFDDLLIDNDALARTYDKTKATYIEIAKQFDTIAGYKDARALAQQCLENAERIGKNAVYYSARELMESNQIIDYQKAIQKLEMIPDHPDSSKQIAACQQSIAQLKARAKLNKIILSITASAVCVFIAFIIVLNMFIIPNNKYRDAIALMDAKEYHAAISAFEALDGYKDSTNKIYSIALELAEIGENEKSYEVFLSLGDFKDSAAKAEYVYRKIQADKLKFTQIGDYIHFGSYEQDNNNSNGKEEIEWRVLDVKNNRILVVSEYGLDGKPYNSDTEYVTWEECTLRDWLNNDFLDSAFTNSEKAMIPTVTVEAYKNHEYSTTPGYATQDKIFLLSIPEAITYFNTYDGECKPTAYAKANGAQTDDGYCWWWLRSPGREQNYAAGVYTFGAVSTHGKSVDTINAIRPAMWIDLNV